MVAVAAGAAVVVGLVILLELSPLMLVEAADSGQMERAAEEVCRMSLVVVGAYLTVLTLKATALREWVCPLMVSTKSLEAEHFQVAEGLEFVDPEYQMLLRRQYELEPVAWRLEAAVVLFAPEPSFVPPAAHSTP